MEHGSFIPLIFSTSGGLGKAASIFYRRLASLKAATILPHDSLDEMPLEFFIVKIINHVFKRISIL